MALEPRRGGDLVEIIDRVLDKGLVINADINISVAGTELLGIQIRAALASFETAARFGLQFPSGTNYETAAWKEATINKEACPQCRKAVDLEELMDASCPWCGWISARARRAKALPEVLPASRDDSA
ncbi:MAG: gas vesicle protein [Bacillota bacterium]|jgi:hypothetical protein